MSNIIGRKSELKILNELQKSNKSELLAIYGRRRVGKTYLIREHFKYEIVFEVTGLYNGNLTDQLSNFFKELQTRNKSKSKQFPECNNWLEAFTLLERYLDNLKSKKKKVVFIDEFPWFATARSKFLMAFEAFWNQYVTKRDDILIIICGSAAYYMVNKVLYNKGGLHNRVSRSIGLLPFNLSETADFLKSRGLRYTHYDVLQLYMATGGVPHYLEKLQKGASVAHNLDELCFSKDGVLKNEFDNLFVSLFDESEKHIAIIKALAKVRKGIARNELLEKSRINSGGDFSLKLNELIHSGFVTKYGYFKNMKQKTLYRLSDEYSLFYLTFILDNKQNGEGTWIRLMNSQTYRSWSGFTFETVCLKHIQLIKRALRIDAIQTANSSWFNDKAQIDLLIDRGDNVINVCEMKFYIAPFTIDKAYYMNLKNKIAAFQLETQTRKNIFLTMITTFGVSVNPYSTELIQNELEMDCFFED